MSQLPVPTVPVRVVLTTLFLALAVLSTSPRAQAQTTPNPPERLSYQGFLADGNGAPLGATTPKNFDVIFRIWDDATATTPANRLWTEQQTVTVDKGYFSVLLGEGSSIGEARATDVSSLFAGAKASDRFVGITVKGIGPGGTDVDILPRLRLLSSPYAFLARNAANLLNAAGGTLVTANGTGAAVNGTITATSFIGSGAALSGLTAGQIPPLDAGKIASGVFPPAQIPALDASKLTTGKLDDARLSQNVVVKGPGGGVPDPFQIGDFSTARNNFVTIATSGGNLWRSGIRFRHFSSDFGWTIESDERTNTLTFFNQIGSVDATPRMTIVKEGRVGIGTTTPTSTLSLKQEGFTPALQIIEAGPTSDYWTLAMNDTSNDLEWWLNGSYKCKITSSGSYVNGSDRRLKQDIERLGPVLDRVLRLEPVSYRFKSSPEAPRKSTGFIAQEVQKLFPDVVDTSGEYLGIAYSEMIPLAFGALQELKREMDATFRRQEETIASLRAALDDASKQDLGGRLKALEASAAQVTELERKAARVDSLEREVAELKSLVHQLATSRTGSRETASAASSNASSTGGETAPGASVTAVVNR